MHITSSSFFSCDCHFLDSLVTSNSFPYASNERREANEIVIINEKDLKAIALMDQIENS